MRRRVGVLVAGVALSCGSDTPREVVWAIDTLTLHGVPTSPEVLQTWTLHDERWETRPRPRTLICGLVVSSSAGEPSQDCEDCTDAWRFARPQLVDSDCEPALLEAYPLLTALTGVGLGPLPPQLQPDAPHPDALAGHVRLADRWVLHGWASTNPRPATDEAPDRDPTWRLDSAWAWDLRSVRGPDRDTDVAPHAPEAASIQGGDTGTLDAYAGSRSPL